MIAAPGLAGLVIEQNDQSRALGITGISRDLQQAQRKARPSVYHKAESAILVGFKKGNKLTALNQCFGTSACPHRKHPARRADIAFRADQHRHDPGFAQPLPGGARDEPFGLCHQIKLGGREAPPDEMRLLQAAALNVNIQQHGITTNAEHFGAPVPPGIFGRICQQGDLGCIACDGWRGNRATKPRLMQGVGANQSTGPVCNGDGRIVPIDCISNERPVHILFDAGCSRKEFARKDDQRC